MRVGSPALLGEGGGHFGVFDDVWPVFEDPVFAGVASFAGGAEDFVDVGEGELPGPDGVDDGSGVVGCAVEDRVESVAPFDELRSGCARRAMTVRGGRR